MRLRMVRLPQAHTYTVNTNKYTAHPTSLRISAISVLFALLSILSPVLHDLGTDVGFVHSMCGGPCPNPSAFRGIGALKPRILTVRCLMNSVGASRGLYAEDVDRRHVDRYLRRRERLHAAVPQLAFVGEGMSERGLLE